MWLNTLSFAVLQVKQKDISRIGTEDMHSEHPRLSVSSYVA